MKDFLSFLDKGGLKHVFRSTKEYMNSSVAKEGVDSYNSFVNI